jgi:segregation and condensation protein A
MTIDLLSRAAVYEVTTPVYQGPLDLLLQLIENAQLDITRLALAQVTDQFLDHLRQLKERSADEVSSFLVIAARLLQIKSEVLLPRPPEREEGEEDPGEALARQLLTYKRYKQVADGLALREENGFRTYIRLAPPPKVEGKIDLEGLGLQELVQAAQYVFSLAKEVDSRPSLDTVVTAPKITVRQKIGLIAHLLRGRERTKFVALLNDRYSRLDIVMTFLAVLELIKRHLLQAYQEQVFGDIELERAQSWDEISDFDLEFGE